jgi:uncharacterized DUF497 family protein
METIPEFEYDQDKSAANLAKHGIDFETAQSMWRDPNQTGGPAHSPNEERWMLVAQLDGKLWSAIYTFRSERIRLISVRRSREDEASQYEHQVH